MPSWLTSAVLALLGALLPTQALVQPAAAPSPPSVIYAYDGLSHGDVLSCVTTERGPPVAHEPATAHGAVDCWAHDASVRPDGTAAGSVITYTTPATFAQFARLARLAPSTWEQAQIANVGLSDLARSGVAANTGRFELAALGGSRYQTPAGLVYGPGSKHGHRLTHVLQHGFPDATKKTHSVFTSGSGALRTVDEAWLMRGAPAADDLGKYVIPMGRTVGTGGETSVTIIVRPGTSQIITAFPSP